MVDGRNITPTMNRQSGKSFAGIALAISVPRNAVRPGLRGRESRHNGPDLAGIFVEVEERTH